MIIVTAALKGGVGKTTTSVYLAALASSNRRTATLVDADPQGSAADWIDDSDDEHLARIEIAEAPTERLLTKALDKVPPEGIGVVDMPPSHERLLNKALERARIVVIPTRVGGVETPRVKAVLELVPEEVPVGLVICSARTYTRAYQEAMKQYADGEHPGLGLHPRTRLHHRRPGRPSGRRRPGVLQEGLAQNPRRSPHLAAGFPTPSDQRWRGVRLGRRSG